MVGVSVIVPAYNASATIRRAIDSVLQQQLQAHEIIVVDDASTDGSAETVSAEYSDRVKLIRLSKNSGAAAARNAAIREASGDLVAFLDADDQWHPSKLKKQSLILRSHPNVEIVSCDALLEDERHEAAERMSLLCPPTSGPDAWKTLLSYNFMATPTVMARRTSIVQVGMFREDLVVGEDLDLWLKLAYRGDVIVLPEVLVTCHRQRSGLMSTTHSGDRRYVLPMIRQHLREQSVRLTEGEQRGILGRRSFLAAYSDLLNGAVLSAVLGLGTALRSRYRSARALLLILSSPFWLVRAWCLRFRDVTTSHRGP